jgi:hypothetical protein
MKNPILKKISKAFILLISLSLTSCYIRTSGDHIYAACSEGKECADYFKAVLHIHSNGTLTIRNLEFFFGSKSYDPENDKLVTFPGAIFIAHQKDDSGKQNFSQREPKENELFGKVWTIKGVEYEGLLKFNRSSLFEQFINPFLKEKDPYYSDLTGIDFKINQPIPIPTLSDLLIGPFKKPKKKIDLQTVRFWLNSSSSANTEKTTVLEMEARIVWNPTTSTSRPWDMPNDYILTVSEPWTTMELHQK